MDRQEFRILAVGNVPTDVKSIGEAGQIDPTQLHIESVDDATSGIDRLAAGDFDCVVSAYILPEQTGIEFLKAVRERHGDLPFVLFSTKGDEMIASRAVSAGATEYVPDVSNVEQPGLLGERIERACGRTRDESQQHSQHSRRVEAVFEHSQRLVVALSPDGTVRDANQTAMEHVEAGSETIIGTPFSETPWWEERAQSDIRRWIDAAGSGKHVEYDTEMMQFGDTSQSASGEIIPVPGRDGTVSELLVIAQGVADRSQNERELVKTRKQLSLALDAADAAVWEMDLETEELYWDEQAQRLWGYEPGEFHGTFEEFVEPVHSDDWERLETAYRTAIETGSSYSVQIRVNPSGKSMRWVEAAGQVITSEDGTPRRLIGLSTDITDRKEREQQLRRQNSRLEEFASVVSHDLRNPLNVAQARAAMLREQGDDESETHFVPLMGALDRIESIIEDTLTLAREGETVGEMDTIEMANLIGNCWASVETAEATLELEDDRVIRGDEDRLRHVFENLFRNAVEHGGDDVTVRVGSAGDESFYVEDDGPGIPVDCRDEVFEAGYTSTNKGTGFGLTIVRRVAEAHGWTATVSSGRDGGARFEFNTAEAEST